VPYRESSESSDGSESPDNPGSPSLEGPAMVPSSSRCALGVTLMDFPWPDLIQDPAELVLPELTSQLAMWPISRKSLATAGFQRKLQACCWPPGGPSQTSFMTHTSGNGVLNEVQIPFQDL